jgi:orotate phosphoribosyltransferase
VQFSLKATAPAGGEFKIEPVKTAWGDFPNAVMHTSIVALQKHPDYSAAKAGDPKAAVRVTRAMVKPDRAAALAANFPEAKLLPVRADEAKGRNALPSALAVVLSSLTGLDIATGIVQASRAHHTGASDVERVERRAEFAGPVEEGGKYILLDDVSTSGSTLAALRAFIRRNGGEVVGVSVLGAAHRPDRGHGSHVALRDETLAELKKLDNARLSGILQRYDLENIEDLSNGEARIILREARKAK